MTNIRLYLKVKKYYYDLFLKPLRMRDKFTVLWRRASGFWRQSPQSLEIGVSYACQLDCGHCGVYGQKQEIPELRLAEIQGVLREAAKLGVYLAVFSGGEPLTRSDICECVKLARDQGMICALSTNGLNLTPALVARLKKSGLVFMNISLDSHLAQVHDARRGRPGCFAQALAAIALCREYKISAIVSTYATRENLADNGLRDLIALAKREQAQGVRILLAVPSGRWRDRGQYVLTPEERAQVRALLDPEYVYVEGICNKFTECSAARKKFFYVSPYGDVQPCSFVPVGFGNIRRQSLSALWPRMRKHKFFHDFDPGDCIMRQEIFAQRYAGTEAEILPRQI